MTPTPKKSNGVLGIRRAAILLVILGEQTSAELLKGLTEEEVQAVSREIARIPSIAPEQAEAVLEDFVELVVPILQERGVYKHQYASGPLRQKLFGRARLPDTHPAATHRRPALQTQQSAAE